MFCENCGSKINEGAAFCPNCGTKCSTVAEVVPEAEVVKGATTEVIAETVAEVATEATTEVAAEAVEEVTSQVETVAEVVKTEDEIGNTNSIQNTIKDNIEKEKEKIDKYDKYRPGASKAVADTESESDKVAEEATTEVANATVEAAPAVSAKAKKEKPVKEKKQKVKKEGKKKTGLIVLVAILAVLAVIGVLAALNFKTINNMIKKATLSPDEYAQYVLKEQAHEGAETIATWYDKAILTPLFKDNVSSSQTISFEASDDGIKLLADALDDDGAEAFKDMDIVYTVQHKGTLMSSTLSVTTQKNEIINIDIIFDKDAEVVYIGIPTASKDYMSLSLSKFYSKSEINDLYEDLDQIAAVGQVSITPKQLQAMIEKYQDVVISNVQGVELGNEDVTIEGVTQNLTSIKFTIDADDVANMLLAVVDEVLNDEELEAYYMDYAVAFDVDDPEDVYEDEFLDEWKDLKNEIKHTDLDDLEIEFDVAVYVNNKGEVTCTSVKYETEEYNWYKDRYEDVTYTFFNGYVISGGKFGYQCSFDNGDEEISLTGSGKISGTKFTGDFELDLDGVNIEFSIKNLDLSKFEKGEFKGDIVIELSQFKKYGLPRELKDTSLLISVDQSVNKEQVFVELRDDEDKMLYRLSLSSVVTNKPNVSVPRNTVECKKMSDIASYLENADFSKLIDTLEDYDIDDVDEAIDDFIDAVDDMDKDDMLPIETLYILEYAGNSSAEAVLVGVSVPSYIRYYTLARMYRGY